MQILNKREKWSIYRWRRRSIPPQTDLVLVGSSPMGKVDRQKMPVVLSLSWMIHKNLFY